MMLAADEFIRRFLLHVLPTGFHRIRHYGLLANAKRKDNVAKARELLQIKRVVNVINDQDQGELSNTKEVLPSELKQATYICPECGGAMVVIETFVREQLPRAPPKIVCES